MNPFTTYQFRKMPVRIVRKSDKNYFVIRDICNILGWSNPNRELAKHTENVPLYERIRQNTPKTFRFMNGSGHPADCRSSGLFRARSSRSCLPPTRDTRLCFWNAT